MTTEPHQIAEDGPYAHHYRRQQGIREAHIIELSDGTLIALDDSEKGPGMWEGIAKALWVNQKELRSAE